MVLLALLAIAVAAVLGAAALAAAWPVIAVGAAVLYCLDRPARRPARQLIAATMVVAAVVYVLGPWTFAPGSVAAVWWFVVPTMIAVLIVLANGGPTRIKARHARAEEQRRRMRAYAADARRQARRDAIRRRTGLDVDTLVAATRSRSGRWARAAGERVTRRAAQRTRPQQDDAPSPWLDLDHDVAADLSRQRSEEILRLAGALDETDTRRR